MKTIDDQQRASATVRSEILYFQLLTTIRN